MQVLGDDRFELRRLVGEGSYGEVYQAYDYETEQHVAVKLMFRAGRDAEARFEREAELLAGLAHPHIVRYVAHGRTAPGQSYLVMEWLQGETLEFRLRRKQMTLEDVLAVAQGAVSGLSFAAQQGIVHRDIKPANLFLVARDCSQLKILDLGLARRRNQDQRLTGTGGLVGTPLYMSPEQARGARDVDPRSDVFSLGSVLYECLCIDRPFEGTHPVATMAKICLEEPVPIEVNTPEVPSRLGKLVHSMLHKDRDRRPAYRWIALELSMIGQAESHSPSPTPTVQARSLHSQGEQRVMCAVFVRGTGQVNDSGEDLGLERELRAVAERFAARRERLLDGSQILVIETHANAIDQALSSAHCALALRALIGPQAPLAVCTGKARVEHGRPLLGELLERGVRLLLETPSGTIRVDDASAALLETRFELGPERALLRERRGGEAPRTLLGQPTRFVGRDRELSQLSLSFRECVEEKVARPVLVTAAPGAGKSRLRYELLESLRGHGEP
ncbi:MAG TPA: serine/threonine-protein kinase, partial [Polyangiales bacterium]